MEALITSIPKAQNTWHIGLALMRDGRPDLAIKAFEATIAAAPDWNRARADLIWARRSCADWSDYAGEGAWLEATAEQDIPPFHLFALADVAEDRLLTAARHRAARLLIEPARHDFAQLSGQRRIRLGYLSADYRDNATTYLLRDLIARHDRSRFEVIGLDIGYDDGSAARQDMLAAFDAVLDLRKLGDAEAAEMIRRRDIAILIDLNGYMGGARPGIPAQRAAPLQVSYLGFAGTMGADFVDYLIADPFVVPESARAHFAESLLRLPHTYQVNDAKRYPAPDLSLPRSDAPFGFCCFNAPHKLTPVFFDVWMRLLLAVPGSVLRLLAAGIAAENLRREAAARGIAPERILCEAVRPHAEHLARLATVDLFLDTLPYNAHTTAADALWCGIPVVTVKGRSFAGRVGESLLHAAGLPELITTSLAEYEALALALARAPQRLAALKAQLRLRQAPLFDMASQSRYLETAYRAAWERWLRGLPPADFSVPASAAAP